MQDICTDEGISHTGMTVFPVCTYLRTMITFLEPCLLLVGSLVRPS